jgi:hypothetical protein
VIGVGAPDKGTPPVNAVYHFIVAPATEGVAVNGDATLFWHKYIGVVTVGGAVARILLS